MDSDLTSAQFELFEWIKNYKSIKKGPVIFFGNEFFDALPIKQVYKKEKIFFEKYVTLSNDEKKNKNSK